MKLAPLLIGGALAYLGWRYLARGGGLAQLAPASGPSAPAGYTPEAVGPSSVGQPISYGASLAPLAAAGPAGAAIAGAGGLLDIVTGGTPQQRQAVADFGNRLMGPALKIFGLESQADSQRANRNTNMRGQAALQQEAQGAEDFMRAQYNALSRPDVEWWRIGQDGRTQVQFSGRAGAAGPWTLDVPSGALNPAAWANDLTARIYGRVVQEGRGPITAPLPLYSDRVGFSTANPFAPRNWQADQLTAHVLGLQAANARSLNRPEPTSYVN